MDPTNQINILSYLMCFKIISLQHRVHFLTTPIILITRNKQPTIGFIDYEYGDYNYREYDIANHFNEFVGMGDEKGMLDYHKNYPSN